LFTVLVVDDESPVRDVVMRMLSEKGYGVLTASSGYEALRILRERPVDAMFTDVVMPGMDGVRLAKEAKALRPGLKVLFGTGYAQRAAQRGAIRSGRVLYKPFRQAELTAAIESVLWA
jgi:CheY-like chemotaxis protein